MSRYRKAFLIWLAIVVRDDYEPGLCALHLRKRKARGVGLMGWQARRHSGGRDRRAAWTSPLGSRCLARNLLTIIHCQFSAQSRATDRPHVAVHGLCVSLNDPSPRPSGGHWSSIGPRFSGCWGQSLFLGLRPNKVAIQTKATLRAVR